MGKLIDLTGMRFGKITVVSRAGAEVTISNGKKSCKATWNCVCDCGEVVIKNTTVLNRGIYTKCKNCAYAERPQSTKRHSAIERLFQLKVVNGSDRRNVEVKMSAQEYYEIAKNACYYCDQPPKEFHLYKGKFSKKESLFVNGVDRVDSSGPYEVSNCVPCCTECNTAKLDRPQNEFFERVIRIYKKHFKKGKKK